MNQYPMSGPMTAVQPGAPVLADEIHAGLSTPSMRPYYSDMTYGNAPAYAQAQQAQMAPQAQMLQPLQRSQPTQMGQMMQMPDQAAVDYAAAAQPQTLQLQPGVSQEAVESPLNSQEAFAASMKALLGRNIGHYVVASFLVGTQSPVSWQGFLHSVGNDYIVIFQPDMGRYVTCDLYSLKFVEFHDQKGVIPQCAGVRRRDGAQIW